MTAEQETTEEQAVTTGEQAASDNSVPKWAEKRFAKLTAEKYQERQKYEEAEKRAQEAERRLQELQGNQTEVIPTLEKFDYDEGKFNQAMGEYYQRISEQTVEKTLNTYQSQLQQQEQKRQQEAQIQQRVDKFYANEAEFRKTHPDYDDVAYNPNLPLTDAVVQSLLYAENPAALAYHLGRNPALVANMASMDQFSLAREMGRIEARLTPNSVTNAPPPIDSPGGNDDVPVGDPDKLSIDEWMKRENAKRRK